MLRQTNAGKMATHANRRLTAALHDRSRHWLSRHLRLLASLLVLALGTLLGAQSKALAADDEDVWPALREAVFGAREVVESATSVILEAPYRAEDAALVPITIRIPAAVSASAQKVTLLIDKNPAAVAAVFTFGPAAGAGERVISTRVRVDMYSNIRAVVEMADGKLLMATKFVKAAGGCSAPALKDTDAVLAEAGKMQVKIIDTAAGDRVREAQVKIRHPQYSGLQLNQATGFYIPAKFLRTIEISRGSDVIFRVDGGISLSEDPNIRFTYAPGGDESIEVVAEDIEGKRFSGRSAPKGS
ncbi:MAG: quinoprotein dehydrogenase-associated SoxYZ-like carrier [Hyphomicrobium sp.]|jgi:sulfur-oxidizing protein SoxY